jgi:hypothetical protein
MPSPKDHIPLFFVIAPALGLVLAALQLFLGRTRLGVERIDLFQLHWPAPQPVEETAAACAIAASTAAVAAGPAASSAVATTACDRK